MVPRHEHHEGRTEERLRFTYDKNATTWVPDKK